MSIQFFLIKYVHIPSSLVVILAKAGVGPVPTSLDDVSEQLMHVPGRNPLRLNWTELLSFTRRGKVGVVTNKMSPCTIS